MSLRNFAKGYAKKIGIKSGNKYGAEKAGDGYPSKLEKAVGQVMEMRQKGGEIRDLHRYPSVEMPYGIRWKVDFGFVYCDSNEPGWAEAKGAWTGDALLKKRMWKAGAGPGPLEIWIAGHGGEPVLQEVIRPRGGAAA